MSDSLGSTTTWVAPDGSNWLFEVVDWTGDGYREEAREVRLLSIDKPKRPVTATLWRSVPIAALISEVRTDRARLRAHWGRSRAS